MNIFQNLKLNTWYGIVLYVGILLIGSSLFFKIDFIEEKHLFGLGLGFFLIGISFFMAERYVNEIKPQNFYTGGAASTVSGGGGAGYSGIPAVVHQSLFPAPGDPGRDQHHSGSVIEPVEWIYGHFFAGSHWLYGDWSLCRRPVYPVASL